MLGFISGCQEKADKDEKFKEKPEVTEKTKAPYEAEYYTDEGTVVHPQGADIDQHGILHVGNYERKGQVAAIMDTVSHEVKATLKEEALIHALLFSHEEEMIVATDYTLHYFNQRVAGSSVTYTMLPEEALIKDMTFSSKGKLYILAHEDGKSRIYHVNEEGEAEVWTTLSDHYTMMKWSDMHEGFFMGDTANKSITLSKVEKNEVTDEKEWVTLPSGTPGGLAVDSLGGVFVTVKNEAQVIRYDKRGKEDIVINLEDPKPGAIALGGKRGRHCFVLTEGSQRVVMFGVDVPGQEWVRANY